MSAQKIMPCLWFDGDAEEAAAHYLTMFRSGRVTSTTLWGDTGPGLPDPWRLARPMRLAHRQVRREPHSEGHARR